MDQCIYCYTSLYRIQTDGIIVGICSTSTSSFRCKEWWCISYSFTVIYQFFVLDAVYVPQQERYDVVIQCGIDIVTHERCESSEWYSECDVRLWYDKCGVVLLRSDQLPFLGRGHHRRIHGMDRFDDHCHQTTYTLPSSTATASTNISMPPQRKEQ